MQIAAKSNRCQDSRNNFYDSNWSYCENNCSCNLVWIGFEVSAALLVAIGCAGEWYLHHHPAGKKKVEKEEHHKLESRFIAAVVVGVFMEFLALGHAIPEAVRLEKNVASANERASTNELAAKQLGIQLNETEIKLNQTKTELANAEARLNESVTNLENANLPMDFGEEYSFAAALKPLAGIQVELRTVADGRAQKTAELLRSTFLLAGWPVINFGITPDIGQEGVVIGYSGDDSSVKTAHLLLKLLTERGVPSEFAAMALVPSTNTIIVAICQRPSKTRADLMILRAKEIGLQDEMREKSPKIAARIFELSTNRYVIGSKEMAAAQSEFNDLNTQQMSFINDEMDLSRKEQKLSEQEDKERFGTNATAPGIHISDSSFRGNTIPIGAFVGTNSPKVFMYGTHINPATLQ